MSEIPPVTAGGEAPVTASTAGSSFDTFLRLAGPIAGFGALSYGVGAAIVWVRYATTGFNADLGLSVASHGQLVFLGFRWLSVWALGVVLATAALNRVRHELAIKREIKWLRPIAWASCALLLALTAFLTWSAFTVALDLTAVVAFLTWRGSQRLVGYTLLFAAVLGAVSAIGWQLEVNLPYEKVRFQLAGKQTPYDGIYFGESDGYFYIAPRANDEGQFAREISVYPASQITNLRLVPKPQTLCTLVNRPSVAFAHEVSSLWETIKQHLRRTGQPAPPVLIKRTAASHPEGYCPPLA